MNELDVVLDTWSRLRASGEAGVLATVVHVSGSAYRRPGAHMLVAPGGARVGTVSGGCLEGEITRKAWWFAQPGTPVVRSYDTSSDDDAVWEFGLGCNGVVQIMLERTSDPSTTEFLEFLRDRRARGDHAVVATVIRALDDPGVHVGDRLLLDGEWVSGGALVGSSIEGPLREHARSRVSADAGCCVVHLEAADVLIEWIEPPLRVFVFGAGDDAQPLIGMGRHLGWSMTVADGRRAYATPQRFPDAERVVPLIASDLLRGLPIDQQSVVVMMTHNFPLDTRLLPLILERQPRYIGMLGPRSRAEKLFAQLGLEMPPSVHAPIGLDIGGDRPAAVALSITAEIQAVTHHRAGGRLTMRQSAIHDPVVERGVSSARYAAASVRPDYCETTIGSHV